MWLNRAQNKSRFWLLLLLLTMLAIAGCAGQVRAPQETVKKVVWPAAPQEARIEWVKSIDVLKDSGAGQGFWGKLKEFFVGREIATIARPYGIATDFGDRLFIADTGASLVHVYNMKDSSYQVVESDSKTRLQTPIGVVYAGNDELLITDSSQGAVLSYHLQDKELHRFTPYDLQRPTGIAFNWRTKQVFVTDTGAHQVIVYDLNGAEQNRFGGRGIEDGKFNYPTDIWCDISGTVYVTDALNARIQVFSAEGVFSRKFGQPGDTAGSFAKPKGVTVDRAGHIYVSDALFDAVQIFDAYGNLLMVFGDNGRKAGQFWMPSGIFADRKGYIYVADTYNRRIQVFKHVNCMLNHDCSK